MFVFLKIEVGYGKLIIPEENAHIKTASEGIFLLKKFLSPCRMRVALPPSFTSISYPKPYRSFYVE
jgi:hypothetical protein